MTPLSTLRELELEQVSPRLLEVLRRMGLRELTGFQREALDNGIVQGRSQILLTHDYNEAYQIAEIAALNIIASSVGSRVLFLCPNPHQAEQRLQSVGHKCRRLGVETTGITRRREAYLPMRRVGRVVVGTYRSVDIAMRVNPAVIEDVRCVVIERLDLIGQPKLGAHLETILATLMIRQPGVQYIAVCPPVSETGPLSRWLDATVVEDKRADIRRIFSVKAFEDIGDSLADLTEFVHYRHGQTMILCSDIETCEHLAGELSGVDNTEGSAVLDLRLTPEHRDVLREIAGNVMRHYPRCEVTGRLGMMITRGVAFMHEGLSKEQRRAVSRGWEEGVIPVVIIPIRFAIASGIRATTVFVIGVFMQDVGGDLSDGGELTMLTEWQMNEVLNSAGRWGQDNDAFGIVVVNSEGERQRVLAKYFRHDSQGNIVPRLGEVVSSMDDPENLLDLALLHLCDRRRRAQGLSSVLKRTLWAVASQRDPSTAETVSLVETASIEGLIAMRATRDAVKRAEAIPDGDVRVVAVSPTRISGIVKSTSRELWHYVELRAADGVSCSCESWKYQGLRKHRLCKHLVKFAQYALEDPDTRPYASTVIRPALRGLEVIGELQKSGLLVREGKTMRCTPLGRSVALLGVPARDARAVMQALSVGATTLGALLKKIVERETGYPRDMVQRVLDSVPAESIEALASRPTDLPGLVENCLEEALYAVSIITQMYDSAEARRLQDEAASLRENLEHLLGSIS